MSAIATPPPARSGTSSTPPVDAACPLCGAPLDPRQEWCLSCGAAARTRLAAPTNWKAPIVAIALVATLALGVLAAALVKLSAGPAPPKAVPPITTTIVTAAPIAPGSAPGAIPTTTTGAAGATGLGSATGLGGAVAPTTTGALAPGTPTTISPSTSTTTGGGAATPTAPTATAPTNTGTGSSRSAEEALRKAGFLPRTKK